MAHFSHSVLSKVINFVSELELLGKWILKIHYYFLTGKKQGEFQKFISINSDTKLENFDRNWMRKMPLKWYFEKTNKNIPNQKSLCEFAW